MDRLKCGGNFSKSILAKRIVEKDFIIKTFVNHFIRKDLFERSYLELTNAKTRERFANRLNHTIEDIVDVRCLERVPKEFDNPEDIQKKLNIKNSELCYVISNYDDFDDELIEFKKAFENLFYRGLASIIVNSKADTIFAVAEQEKGSAPKYIGRKR